jgi:hypothetical protein
MSDYIFKIIPEYSTYVPEPQLQEKGKAYLKSILGKDSGISMFTTENIEFIDCGQNLESVKCPFCNQELDMDWWGNEMDRAFNCRFEDSNIPLPCCGEISELNNLIYIEQCGFAKFVIEILNPEDELMSDNILALGQILKCNLKKIKVHY